MAKAIWAAVWEWLPGVVAGGLPLIVFAIHDFFARAKILADAAAATAQNASPPVADGWATHMLILAIATASVTVVTAFSRLARGKVPNFLREGRGPVLLTILLLVVLVYVVGLYMMREVGEGGRLMNVMAFWGLMAALIISLYMEFAIARLHELASERRRRSRQRRAIATVTP